MANLRELRAQAKELGVGFDKTTVKEELEELIAAKLASAADTEEAPAAPPVKAARTPVPLRPAAPVVSAAEEAHFDDTVLLDFKTDIQINATDLNTEFVQQASLFGHYGMAAVTAESRLLAAKLRAETVEAQLFSEYRVSLATESNPKPTEKLINAAVVKDPRYQKARTDLVAASERAGFAKTAKEAFAHRRDMLRELGSGSRWEKSGDMTMLHEKAKTVLGTGTEG
jgi:hypothetical protein